MANKNKLMAAALGGLLEATGACGGDSADKMSGMDHNKIMAGDQCYGVNSCKGKGSCAQQEHDCAGKNSCKGKGWLKMSKTECETAGGTFSTGS